MRLSLFVCLSANARAFYLPGVAPREYMPGDSVDVKVNKLSSSVTQLPYDYYNLAFCKPKELKYAAENLGEVLHGSMIQNSAYELQMQKSDFKVLCMKTLTETEAQNFAKRIQQDYRVQMIMDNLPAATRMISEMPDGKTVTMYDRGYRCAPPSRLARAAASETTPLPPLHSNPPTSQPTNPLSRPPRPGSASSAPRSSLAPSQGRCTSTTTCASSSSTTRTRCL